MIFKNLQNSFSRKVDYYKIEKKLKSQIFLQLCNPNLYQGLNTLKKL